MNKFSTFGALCAPLAGDLCPFEGVIFCRLEDVYLLDILLKQTSKNYEQDFSSSKAKSYF